MPAPDEVISSYVRGKDHNRPHLLDQAFATDARLTMQVQPGAAITFPPLTTGRAAIAAQLVSSFNQRHENIYTFCIGAPPPRAAPAWRCDWLVVMSEKTPDAGPGTVRIGCGRYGWRFEAASGLASALHIAIEQMHLLPPEVLPALAAWAAQLPYPWCPAERLAPGAPDLPALRLVLQRLMRPTAPDKAPDEPAPDEQR